MNGLCQISYSEWRGVTGDRVVGEPYGFFFCPFWGPGGWKEREEKVEWCLVCESGNNWNSCKGGKSFFVSIPSLQHFSTPLKCAYDVGMSVSMRIIATFWHNGYIILNVLSKISCSNRGDIYGGRVEQLPPSSKLKTFLLLYLFCYYNYYLILLEECFYVFLLKHL